MNPNANTLTLLVWQPLEEQQTQHVPEPSKDYATITTTVTQKQVPLACFEITSMSKGTTDTMAEPYTKTVDACIALAAGDTGAVPTAAQLGVNDSLVVNFLHHGQLSGPAEESDSNSLNVLDLRVWRPGSVVAAAGCYGCPCGRDMGESHGLGGLCGGPADTVSQA